MTASKQLLAVLSQTADSKTLVFIVNSVFETLKL